VGSQAHPGKSGNGGHGAAAVSTFDRLSDILNRDHAVSAGSLTADTTLASLAIDSLALIELIFAIEDTFGISVPDADADMAKEFGTLGELSNYVDNLIMARDAAASARPVAVAREARLPAAE
jgi:acyl carrier protein